MLNSFDKSFAVAGCGRVRFGSLGAYGEFGKVVRRLQSAIVGRREALFNGENAENAAALLSVDLRELGMDEESIQEHIDDPQKDVEGLFVRCADLTDEDN